MNGLWRYYESFSYLSSYTKEANEKFVKLYDYLDDPNHSFKSVEEMLKALDLAHLTTLD